MTIFAPSKEKLYTLEEYLTLEETAEVKHEFHAGKRIQMPGGKLNHNAISMNVGHALIQAIDNSNKNCLVLSSDMKIFIAATNRVVYPDAAVLCETPQFYNDRQDLLLNPLLIIEVLSDSTEGYDRGEKFNYYTTLPSFKEYVMVSQNQPLIETLFLQNANENLWKHSRGEGLEAEIQLFSLDCKIALKEVYKRVEFPLTDSEQPASA